MKKILWSCLAICLAATGLAFGGPRTEGPWQRSSNDVGPTSAEFTVDSVVLRSLLQQAPEEFSAGAMSAPLEIALPMPDGAFARFNLEASPIMAPELAARYPDLASYKVLGIDEPTAFGRLTSTPNGLHGMILTRAGTVRIDPREVRDGRSYVSRYEGPSDQIEDFLCGFEEPAGGGQMESGGTNSTGDVLRTYDLALATTGEFYRGVADEAGCDWSSQNCDSDVNTTLNIVLDQLNTVLESELSVRLELINQNDDLLFDNPGTDCYSDGYACTMANQNKTTVDHVLCGCACNGSCSCDTTGIYDIGHVFGKYPAAGGFTGCVTGGVCSSTSRAGGATHLRTYDPLSGYLLTLHEMGHQFGASHTYNGSSCLQSQYQANHAYEPGSGSTLMSYANSCPGQNVQTYRDPYYHTHSFDQIVNKMNSTSCETETPTGNSPPDVDALTQGDIVIPRRTPFTLTGDVTDPDADVPTYNWEQHDVAVPDGFGDNRSHPLVDPGGGPLLRSVLPGPSESRSFPQRSDLLENRTSIGHLLPIHPDEPRVMHFRLTARDGRGGVAYDERAIGVEGDPFNVNEPGKSARVGSECLDVKWGSTGAADLGVDDVNILLSDDSGVSFDPVATGTPNDGQELLTSVSCPIDKDQAALKLEPVNTATEDFEFFDISPLFSVECTGTCPPAGSCGGPTSGCRVVHGSCYTYSTGTVSCLEGGDPVCCDAREEIYVQRCDCESISIPGPVCPAWSQSYFCQGTSGLGSR